MQGGTCQMVLQSLRDLQEFSTLMNWNLLSLGSKTSCIIYRTPFRKELIASELLDFYRAQELPSQIRPAFQLAWQHPLPDALGEWCSVTTTHCCMHSTTERKGICPWTQRKPMKQQTLILDLSPHPSSAPSQFFLQSNWDKQQPHSSMLIQLPMLPAAFYCLATSSITRCTLYLQWGIGDHCWFNFKTAAQQHKQFPLMEISGLNWVVRNPGKWLSHSSANPLQVCMVLRVYKRCGKRLWGFDFCFLQITDSNLWKIRWNKHLAFLQQQIGKNTRVNCYLETLGSEIQK